MYVVTTDSGYEFGPFHTLDEALDVAKLQPTACEIYFVTYLETDRELVESVNA